MKVAKISNPCHVNSSFRYKFRRIERFSVGIPFYELKIPSSYIRTRGISRVTTLIRKLLAQLTSMSVRQHSSAFNVHQSVTAYLLNQSVQCTARGGISCGKVCHICVACMTRTNAIIGFLIAPQDNQPVSPVGIP